MQFPTPIRREQVTGGGRPASIIQRPGIELDVQSAGLQPRWRSWSIRAALGWLCLLACLIGPRTAHGQISREYQIKAVFLYNFVQFTEWPTNAFESTNSPIVIGIVGSDPFGHILDDTVRDETVRGRRLLVERYPRLEEIKTCHILFISRSEEPRLDKILERVKAKPILTVSEIEGAAYRGVMIRFVIAESKIRLRVNLDAVSEAELTVSSKLLRVAEVVSTKKNP